MTEEKLQEGDFIEIEFTGKTKDEGEIFDSNIKEDLEKVGSKQAEKAKPYIYGLGQGMFLQGLDEELIGKTPGEYSIDLPVEKAFGKRQQEKIKKMPEKVFQNQQQKPQKGMFYNFDGELGKVISVSGGRVLVDFNNPVAGKDVTYKIIVKRKVTDLNEKVAAFNNFIFKQDLDFEIKDKTLTFKIPKSLAQLEQYIVAFKEKYKELFGLDVQVEIKEDKKEEKSQEQKEKDDEKTSE